MRKLQLLLTAVTLSASAATTHAEEAYEGRVLPDGLKRILWDKACDVVQKRSIDCAAEPCIFKDSKGERFSPDMQPWHNVLMFEWNVGTNALQPAVIAGGLAKEEEVQDPRTALGLLSGLQVDLKPDDYLMQLNPALIRWVARELIPPAATPMCGATAKEVYASAFKGPIRQAVDVYALLKAKGLTRAVKEAELAKNFNEQRGRYASTCQAIAKKSPDDERWGRESLCWWWLRRVSSGGADELLMLFGRVLGEYDAEAATSFSKVFPKTKAPPAPRQRPTVKTF